ncbi:hypothetical protein FACJOVSR_CDS0033 [Staphylococcus phage PG-2021_67]
MKYIMAQPAVLRFEWETQVCIHNLLKNGINKENIIILFSKHDDSVVKNIQKTGVNVHVYEDERFDFEYIPSLKPYLMYRYLEEDIFRENETYFYMDSDVILREVPDYSKIETSYSHWCGSDCNGYLNYDYIIQCEKGKEILQGMADIIGISVEDIYNMNNSSIGAQYVISEPMAGYFKKVYEDSIKLWKYIKDIDTNFQKWAVEMNATIWNMPLFNIVPHVSKELSFCWATDPIDKWYENKIFHNAGVAGQDYLFFKGGYNNTTPFNKNHDYVSKDYASYKYLENIKETEEWLK